MAGSFAAAQTPKKKDAGGKPAPAKLGVPPKKETPTAAVEPHHPAINNYPIERDTAALRRGEGA